MSARYPARLSHYFERTADATPDAVAIEAGEETITYDELERRANRLAHYLSDYGAGPGTTVGILLERSVETYVALLGVLKSGAAYVPMDVSYPAERIAFMASDSATVALVTTSNLAPDGLPCPAICLDRVAAEIAAQPPTRVPVEDRPDDLAYIIYTSGTTGRPKGVGVTHANVCFFLAVCSPIYGESPTDRVYQGITLAFDFSIEEVWIPWIAGATLVFGATAAEKVGSGLADFLARKRITVLTCVPTLLATIDRDLPLLETIIVGGEACPRDLVERWSRPGRRMLNTYGPTETTATATWCELIPGRPVTIGRPLPGYRVYILDENRNPVPHGEAGEIVIGGMGVAAGYRNRPELTAEKFLADPFDTERQDARMYRSGDLGRFTEDGEIEYLGRIDTQVKIRGYRIEVSEIESVLLEDEHVEMAVVAPVKSDGP